MSATIHHGNLIPVRRELRPLKRYRVLPTSVSLVTRVFLRSTASFSKCFTFFQLLLRRWIRPVWGQDPCVRHPVASTDPGSTSPASGRRRELSHHAALRAWGGSGSSAWGETCSGLITNTRQGIHSGSLTGNAGAGGPAQQGCCPL